MIERLGSTLEKCIETVVGANEVADLGAVKPEGFGSLIRKRYFSDTGRRGANELGGSVFSKVNLHPNLFGRQNHEGDSNLLVNYNEASRECSEYLFDYGITPQAWENAVLEQRMDMQKRAAQIMLGEFGLSEKWTNSLELSAVHGGERRALAKCEVKHLSSGGIDVSGVPTIEVDVDRSTDDYFAAMRDIYHEMVHLRQLASVDNVSPTSTTDPELLDLINYFGKRESDVVSDADYLSFPHEAEAWTQALYFKDVLYDVANERGL